MEGLDSAAKYDVSFDKQRFPAVVRGRPLNGINLKHLRHVLLAADLRHITKSAARPVSTGLHPAVMRGAALWFGASSLGFKPHQSVGWHEMPGRG